MGKSLAYIGHSQGTIQAFAAFSRSSELASKVNLYVALAPVAYVHHQSSFVLTFLAETRSVSIVSALGVREFLQRTWLGRANMKHWSQGVDHDAFQMYDYGSSRKNMAKYNRSTPPSYNLSAITVKMAIY